MLALERALMITSLKDIKHLKRVAVIGTSCSGKTTFARSLAQMMQVKHIELDAIYWLSNWTPRSEDEFRTLTQAAIAEEKWLLDGNYSRVRDIVWSQATALIWLNYSFPVVARRALGRTIRRVFDGEVLYSENREIFCKAFLSRDSILLWVLKTYRRHRHEYPRLFQEPQHRHLQIFVLRSPEEADRFLFQVMEQQGRDTAKQLAV